MKVKCPNCAAQLVFKPEDGKLHCEYCDSIFSVEEIEQSEAALKDEVYSESSDEDTMETEIYICKSCGAELMINNVEAASFCAYCGQSTIIFNRVSKQKKPKYIIPFKITKEQAEEKIRKKLKKSFLIPKAMKEFKTEVLRGIYIPFWLVDMKYESKMLIRGTEGSGDDKKTYYYAREAVCDYKKIPVDASKKFDDESSSRLEPFDYSQMKDFDINYLSGFYADCGDEDEWKVEANALSKARRLFEEKILKTVHANEKKIIQNNPKSSVAKKEYAMLPVWFLVFSENGKHYTIMVNGETGKLVGALPFEKVRTSALTTAMCVVLGLIGMGIGSLFGLGFSELEDFEDLFEILVGAVIGIIGIAGVAISKYEKFIRSCELTGKSEIKDLAVKRQED